jgi:hypothetical protein
MSAASPHSADTPTVAGAARPRRTAPTVLKDIVLFFVAPFVTLVYLALFPFIGFATVVKAWRDRKAAG